MNTDDTEKLLYYAANLYYEMAEELKNNYEEAFKDLGNLKDFLVKDIVLKSKFNEDDMDLKQKDQLNIFLGKYKFPEITDGTKFPTTIRNIKRSHSKRRKKSPRQH